MKLHTAIILLAAGSQLGATECGSIIEDPGFDHWCGDKLCFWDTERGEIRRAATWHEGDDGVEFVSDDVAISQLTPVNSYDTDCILFEFLADVEETAEVHLEADVFGDGTVDWRERVPTARWQKITMLVGIDGAYEGIRFRLTKVGPGRAVLAQIAAQVEEGACPSYVDVVSRPLGARCAEHGDCESEICNGYVCSECNADDQCGAGDVCGRQDDAPGHLADWWTCIEGGSRGLHEKCFDADECASGVCADVGYCVECSSGVPCPDGEQCELDGNALVCSGDARPAGRACLANDQCASGVCDGRPVGWCDGGWDLCYEDDDCPAGGDLSPGTCTFTAVAGGTCQ